MQRLLQRAPGSATVLIGRHRRKLSNSAGLYARAAALANGPHCSFASLWNANDPPAELVFALHAGPWRRKGNTVIQDGHQVIPQVGTGRTKTFELPSFPNGLGKGLGADRTEH